MAEPEFYIDTKTGVKRRKLPGDVARDGEVLFIPMEAMHKPATLKLSDAQGGGVTQRVRLTEVAGPIEPAHSPVTRDGGSSPTKTKDGASATTFVDPYGRVLASGATSGDERADGKAIGAQLSYEHRTANAWKEPFPAPPEPDPVTYGGSGKAKGHDTAPAGNGWEGYERRVREAWKSQ